PAGRRGRRPAGRPREGAPHSFQARPEEVRQAMLELCPALARPAERTPWRLARHDIRLPSGENRPLHSPVAARGEVSLGEYAADEPAGESQPTVGIWQVRGVALEPVRAVRLLASLAEQRGRAAKSDEAIDDARPGLAGRARAGRARRAGKLLRT